MMPFLLPAGETRPNCTSLIFLGERESFLLSWASWAMLVRSGVERRLWVLELGTRADLNFSFKAVLVVEGLGAGGLRVEGGLGA